jgi:hypothetical protein
MPLYLIDVFCTVIPVRSKISHFVKMSLAAKNLCILRSPHSSSSPAPDSPTVTPGAQSHGRISHAVVESSDVDKEFGALRDENLDPHAHRVQKSQIHVSSYQDSKGSAAAATVTIGEFP